MYELMARQQKLSQRELAIKLIRRHGVHFVVTEIVVRSKDGKLADRTKPERRGDLGLNWAAQNTGALSYLVLWLEGKVKERGGTVVRRKLVLDEPPVAESLDAIKLLRAHKLMEMSKMN